MSKTKKLKDLICSFHLSFGIALFHKKNGNIEISLNLLEKISSVNSFAIFGKESYLYAYVLFHLSQIYRQLGDINKAYLLAKETVDISSRLSQKELLILSLNNKALLLQELKEYKMSQETLEYAIEIRNKNKGLFQKMRYEEPKDVLYHNLAQIFCYRNRLGKAKNIYIENLLKGNATDKRTKMELIMRFQLSKIKILKMLRFLRLDVYVNIILKEDFYVSNDFLKFIISKVRPLPQSIFQLLQELKGLLKELYDNFWDFPYEEMFKLLNDFDNLNENSIKMKFFEFPEGILENIFFQDDNEDDEEEKIKLIRAELMG